MACRAVQMWSLTSLITAFLDLIVAYLLLSASALAFFASKFLNIIGLNLPCPCHGLFFDIHSPSLCLNRLLVDFPVQKVSDVLLYVKQNYPFNGCTCNRTSSNPISISAVNDSSNGFLQIDCDASCSSVSDSRRSIDGSSVRAEKYDVKGKGVALCHRRRTTLRARRKHVSDRKKHISSLSSNPPRDEEARYHYGGFVDDDDLCVKNKLLSTSELYRDVSQGDLISSGDEKRVIRILERALEQERASRAALYIELEKERSASATAADEAMSMILRLQEEKAAVEMESRQYQRIIEEKTAHDAEEMNILKEILVRREKEKLFLEKEVEGYRQMISLDDDDYYDEQLFPGMALDEVEQSISRGLGDLSEKSLQMKTECSDLTGPQECEFEMKIDTLDAKHDEEDEALSPEEKIIETCDGIESNNPYKGTSVEQQASTSQVVHERDYVPVETSVMESLNTVTNNASTSRTGNGTRVKRCSLEKTNAALHLPPMRPQVLSLLTELRRNSLSCADKEMLNTDTEVELLIEKLKIVRDDREKLISSSIENQEQGDMRTKSLDDMKGRVLESDSRKVISQVLSKKRRCRSVSSGLWTNSKGTWEH